MKNSTGKPPDVTPLVDRISNFPDDILCHILSFFNTREAVATSRISKRWKYLWTYFDTLEFKIIGRGNNLKFEKYVNKALEHHRGHIKRMCLDCYTRCNNHDIVNWIETAISKEVETLHLSIGDISDKFPICLFPSQTLVELKLEYAHITTINIPTAPFFPQLKKLNLFQPTCKKDFLSRFISGCPILEYFELEWEDRYGHNDSVEPFYISSVTLKAFRFQCSLSYFDNPKIVLNTPALEILTIWFPGNSEFLVKSSMPYLQKADICIRPSDFNDNSSSGSSSKYLEFLTNVSVLCCQVHDCFYPRTMYKLNLHTHFNNLTRLEIIASKFGLDLLRIFIEKCNNLKDITLEKWAFEKESEVIWEEPQHVPKCLLSSLQSVTMYGYRDHGPHPYREEMIKYFLGNAKVLKQLEIRKSIYGETDDEFRNHMLQKISMFPKASVICEISIN